MLTRGQVARRLGKSIATVRRLEGVRLFPTVDARGFHRFDPNEVDALKEQITNGASVGSWGESESTPTDPVDAVAQAAVRLRVASRGLAKALERASDVRPRLSVLVRLAATRAVKSSVAASDEVARMLG